MGAKEFELTAYQLALLPEGTTIKVTWDGGNGPHLYRLHHERDMSWAAPLKRQSDFAETYNPLLVTYAKETFIKGKAWLTEPISRDMNIAIGYFKANLPNWWYTSGDCFVSADASVGPDPNSSKWDGPDIYDLIKIDERFNSGFHLDMPHPYHTAQSLIDLTNIARPVWQAALKELGFDYNDK